MAEDLAAFVRDVLELEGAIAERGEDGTTLALLPPPLAERLRRPEEFRFHGGVSETEGEQLAFGSDVLAEVAEMARARGRTAVGVTPAGYLKKGDLTSIVSETLQVSRAAQHFEAASEALVSYLVVRVHYRAVSVETREGFETVVLNESSGALVDGMSEALESMALAQTSGRERVHPRRTAGELLARAQRITAQLLEGQVAELRGVLERRAARDWRRILEYYCDLRNEMDKRCLRAMDAEARDRLTSKREAIAADLQSKRADLASRYAIRLEMEVASALRVFVRVLRLPCRLALRHAERRVEMFWNPLTKAVERLYCEACGRTSRALIACDELHLVCAACGGHCAECGKRICKVCTPRGCHEAR
jgi:hypothetical protein